MLIEFLRRGAQAAPDQPAVISAGRPVSYAECLARSEDVARGLRVRGIERFGSAVDDPADVLAVLAGASAVGSEACLYPRWLGDGELDDFATRFGHATVVTDGDRALAEGRGLSLDELPRSEGELPAPPPRAPVLILTTGTTGTQKGARHDWARLAAAVRHPDDAAATRWLLAYNLNQFAGVQILLHVLVSRGTLVVATSNRPADGIDAMREARVTHASATPTFWRLLAGSLDAGSARELALAQITLGGEPAPASLIARLRELFPAARISHVYAGTEFGSAVSVRDGAAGLPRSVLDRADDADVQLRISDGELQVRSRVGMLGYHEGDDVDAGWHSTGDLVEVRGDRIEFVGRTTDVINVGGAKVHPLPIEELACAVQGVTMAVAYGRPNPITGQIVALDVVAAAGADPERLEEQIRDACEGLPRAGRPRRIRFVDEIETRGNKLRRAAGERT